MTRMDLYERIYDVIAHIPPGQVATYGQVAFLAGIPRGARMAGQALSHVPEGYDLPCHRVVNSQGRLAPGYDRQKALLRQEGITFSADGRVDMKRHLWTPSMP